MRALRSIANADRSSFRAQGNLPCFAVTASFAKTGDSDLTVCAYRFVLRIVWTVFCHFGIPKLIEHFDFQLGPRR